MESNTWNVFETEHVPVNELYLWDALWLNAITTLTVGYGDLSPHTEFGRVTQAMIALIGILLASVLAGFLTTMLHWEPEVIVDKSQEFGCFFSPHLFDSFGAPCQELTVLRILEREKARAHAKKLAASRLKYMMKHYVKRFRERHAAKANSLHHAIIPNLWGAKSRISSEASELTGRLRRLQHLFMSKESYTFLSDEYKVDRLYDRVKFSNRRLIDICHKLIDPEALYHCLQRREEEGSLEYAYSQQVQRSTSANEKTLKRLATANGQTQKRQDDMPPVSLVAGALQIKRRLLGSIYGNDRGSTGKAMLKDKPVSNGSAESRERTAPRKPSYSSKIATEFDVTDGSVKSLVDITDDSVKSLADLVGHRHWLKDKKLMLSMWERARYYAAGFAVLGTLSAMWQHEMLMSGDGSKLKMDLLKAANSLCTILCAVYITRIYHLRCLIERYNDHVHKLQQYDTSGIFWNIVLKGTFWLELILVIVHCPPRIEHGFGILFTKNFVAYRIESVLCCANMFRFYLLWNVMVTLTLSDLPKSRETLSGFTNVQLGATFAIKRMLNSWLGFFYLCTLWALSMLWFGYWYRAAECTACQFPDIGLKPM